VLAVAVLEPGRVVLVVELELGMVLEVGTEAGRLTA
jgi:hypothetical protein